MMAESLDVCETVIEESVIIDEGPEEIIEESVYEKDLEALLEQQSSPASVAKPTEKVEKLAQLPLSRIKSIIKLDPDVTLASQEAVLLIAKATELFVETLGREAYKFTQQNKKKTIQRKDVDDCIDAIDAFAFLEGTLDS